MKINLTLPFIVLALILTIGMGLRLRGIATTHQERAISRPLEDDSYFYFSLGAHIADGNGARIDDLHLTTGFQPLWGAVVAVVFVLIRDHSHAISAVQLVGALAGVLGAILIYDLARRITRAEWAGLVACALWFWSPQAVRHQLNGMETGIATIASFAVLYSTYRAWNARRWRWHIGAAVVFGVAVLARIDTLVLIAPCGLALMMLVPPSATDNARSGGLAKRISAISLLQWIIARLRVGMVMGAVGIACLLPWALFTLSIEKPLLPESGDAVRAASLYVYPDPPPQPVLTVLTENPDRFFDYYGGWAADFTRSLASQVWAIAPFSDAPKYPADPVDSTRLSARAYLFLGAVLMMVGMAVFSREAGFRVLAVIYGVWWLGLTTAYVLVIYGIWYFARYSLPLAEVVSVLVVIGVCGVMNKGLNGKGLDMSSTYSPYRAWRIGAVVLGVYLLFIMAGHIHTYTTDDFYTWMIDGAESLREDGWDVAIAWLHENVPQEARVGSVFASGVVGFYAPQTVVNLDGKVNREAYYALVAGDMWAYLCRAEIDYTVDWWSSTDGLIINRAPRHIWQEDNMPLVIEIPTQSVAPVQIRRVNRDNCE